MINKYASQLISGKKLKEFDGFINFGYLVKSIPITRRPTDLKYDIFLGLLKHYGINLDNKRDVFSSLIYDESTSMIQNEEFIDEFNVRLQELKELKVPEYLAHISGIGFFVTIISFIAVLFIKWWMVFIIPPFIWFLTHWFKNLYILNYTAIVAICAYLYKDFRQHLIRHGDLVDVLDLENPKEELQKFRLISTFGSNGAGAISTSFNMTHDSGILTKVYSDLVHQKGILLSIRVQLMKLSNQKLRKKLLDDLENESWE